MVDRAFLVVLREDNASEGASDNGDTVWPIAIIGVPELFLLEVNELKVDPLLTAFTPDLWDDYAYPRWF